MIGALSIPHTVNANSCYKDGYKAGRDEPFSPYRFSQCGDVYTRGFIAGCLSVKGNTEDACNTAEASYPHPNDWNTSRD
jgi:hypothetical protein